ncbi:Protein of unknown function [Pyronema omphalodes CBS 100304]|uniref:Uncharacterized protein n=1 Tax=Pyronema omphalodes (strain CBS 100304) TaxID=1076935 RepID=U4L0J6_PYROM|nr:Protein of unknown function [Pyronema omphalodes CBS 100304]
MRAMLLRLDSAKLARLKEINEGHHQSFFESLRHT